jgi:NAD+ synthase
MDLCLYARNEGLAAEEIAATIDLTTPQVERVFSDITAKRRATRYQHLPPLVAEPVPEI